MIPAFHSGELVDNNLDESLAIFTNALVVLDELLVDTILKELDNCLKYFVKCPDERNLYESFMMLMPNHFGDAAMKTLAKRIQRQSVYYVVLEIDGILKCLINDKIITDDESVLIKRIICSNNLCFICQMCLWNFHYRA